jgi:signal transduction histidine kinase
MSHELRTPMNSIIGFSSFFREEGIDKATRERYCDIIEQNANQLLALINDIIDIAKIESGELSFAPNKSKLFELVNTLVVESEKKIERKNKKIKIFLDFDLPTKQEINTDVTRFKQLMNNLLYNAIKYTEEGHIKVNCKAEGKMFLFSVSDTGIGISDLMKEKVFDRFTREEDAKKLYSGTGLGLAIAKSIVEKWGGEIWFKSEKNKGSTFYFHTPNIVTIEPDQRPSTTKTH